MNYERLRLVMIGFAKLQLIGQSYHNVCKAKSQRRAKASLIALNLKGSIFVNHAPPKQKTPPRGVSFVLVAIFGIGFALLCCPIAPLAHPIRSPRGRFQSFNYSETLCESFFCCQNSFSSKLGLSYGNKKGFDKSKPRNNLNFGWKMGMLFTY